MAAPSDFDLLKQIPQIMPKYAHISKPPDKLFVIKSCKHNLTHFRSSWKDEILLINVRLVTI